MLVSSVIYPIFYKLTNEVANFKRSWEDNISVEPVIARKVPDTDGFTDTVLKNAFQRFLKLIPDVTIEMGTFYSYVKTTAATFNLFLVEYTINLLLAFKV